MQNAIDVIPLLLIGTGLVGVPWQLVMVPRLLARWRHLNLVSRFLFVIAFGLLVLAAGAWLLLLFAILARLSGVIGFGGSEILMSGSFATALFIIAELCLVPAWLSRRPDKSA